MYRPSATHLIHLMMYNTLNALWESHMMLTHSILLHGQDYKKPCLKSKKSLKLVRLFHSDYHNWNRSRDFIKRNVCWDPTDPSVAFFVLIVQCQNCSLESWHNFLSIDSQRNIKAQRERAGNWLPAAYPSLSSVWLDTIITIETCTCAGVDILFSVYKRRTQ